jgi:hypothetical protein
VALSSKWTLTQIIDAVRVELQDPSKRWWSDSLLSAYADDWQNGLNEDFEFSWGTSTTTTTATTLDIQTVMPSLKNVGRVYCDGFFLPSMTTDKLTAQDKDWRDTEDAFPSAFYWVDKDTLGIYPKGTETHTYVFEYPLEVAMTTGTDTMSAPAWMKYSSINYCCFRAYANLGPNHDPQKAARYKAKYSRELIRIRKIYAGFFYTRAPMLRPGGRLETKIVHPIRTYSDGVLL